MPLLTGVLILMIVLLIRGRVDGCTVGCMVDWRARGV